MPDEMNLEEYRERLEKMSTEELVEEALRNRETYLSAVDAVRSFSHDTNDLLTSIGGLSNVIAKEAGRDSPQRKFADAIREDAIIVQEIMRDMLSPEALRGYEPQRELLNLYDDVVMPAVNMTAAKRARKRLNIDHSSSAGADEVIYADRHGMIRVYKNLISNAVTHGKKGGRITYGKGEGPEKGFDLFNLWNMTEYTVPEGELGIIFERHVRGSGAKESGNKEGYGLGLDIVKNVIEKHGGRVWAESGNSPDIKVGPYFNVLFTLPKGPPELYVR